MPTKNPKKNYKPEKQEPKQKAEAKIDVSRMHPKLRRLKKLSSKEV